MLDSDGNEVAKVLGGPLDGGTWSSNRDWTGLGADSTFVPGKTSHGRPRYRFQPGSRRADGEDAWVFEAWEPEENDNARTE